MKAFVSLYFQLSSFLLLFPFSLIVLTDQAAISRRAEKGLCHNDNYRTHFCQLGNFSRKKSVRVANPFNVRLSSPAVMGWRKPRNVRNPPRPGAEAGPLHYFLCYLQINNVKLWQFAFFFFFLPLMMLIPPPRLREITFKTFPFNVCQFPSVEVFSLWSGSWRWRACTCARTSPGNIKSLRKSIWALGAASRDGRSSGGRKSPADVGTEILEDLQSSSLKEDLFKVEQWQWQESLQTWLYNIVSLQDSGWFCEEKRTGVNPLFSFQATKQRLDVSARSSSYYIISADPPQPKEIGFGFWFFSFHFMKFYLLFSFDHFMLWCLLCVESPFQLCDCGSLYCP